MVYGYVRVSTKGQARDGNSLEAQENELRANGATEIVVDSHTGAKPDKPGLAGLLAPGRLNPGDTLMVTKLDRMARSLSQGNELVNSLISRGIKVHILNIGVLDNSAASRLVRNIFFSFAEFEREMIIERTQEGRAIARQDPDYREGRPPKFSAKHKKHALDLLETNTYRQVTDMTGISKSTLIRAKRAQKP